MKTKDAASCRFERLDILSDGDAAQLRKLAFQLTPHTGKFGTRRAVSLRSFEVLLVLGFSQGLAVLRHGKAQSGTRKQTCK